MLSQHGPADSREARLTYLSRDDLVRLDKTGNPRILLYSEPGDTCFAMHPWSRRRFAVALKSIPVTVRPAEANPETARNAVRCRHYLIAIPCGRAGPLENAVLKSRSKRVSSTRSLLVILAT